MDVDLSKLSQAFTPSWQDSTCATPPPPSKVTPFFLFHCDAYSRSKETGI